MAKKVHEPFTTCDTMIGCIDNDRNTDNEEMVNDALDAKENQFEHEDSESDSVNTNNVDPSNKASANYNCDHNTEMISGLDVERIDSFELRIVDSENINTQ